MPPARLVIDLRHGFVNDETRDLVPGMAALRHAYTHKILDRPIGAGQRR